MKLFLDTAEVDQIREIARWGVLDGVTTNPSLIAKSGRDFREVVQEICSIVDGPVSAECLELDAAEMIPEARELAKIHEQVVVKVPMTPAGLETVSTLVPEGIHFNVTLVFSAPQALLAAKAGATFISPFVGRLDDRGQVGMEMIADIVQMFQNYDYPAEVLVASIRDPNQVVLSAKLGADIATVPYGIFKKLVTHPLTDEGIARFLADWEQAKK